MYLSGARWAANPNFDRHLRLRGMTPTELQPGLWRWSAPHPDWHPDAPAGSSSDWPQAVGCALYESEETAVFIDPLVPSGDERAFWQWADERCAGRAVLVLITLAFHRRSRDAFVARYRAGTSRAKRSLPADVHSFHLKGAGETVFWLPRPRALVVGDRVVGAQGASLALCPQSWLDYLPRSITVTRLGELLRPLLELPIEIVLVSHGDPVLSDGRAALERALSR
jgi:hypothetical protein